MVNEAVNENKTKMPAPRLKPLSKKDVWSILDSLHSHGMLSLVVVAALIVSFFVISNKRPNDAPRILAHNAFPSLAILCIGVFPLVIRGHVIPRVLENANNRMREQFADLLADLRQYHYHQNQLLQQKAQLELRVSELNTQVVALSQENDQLRSSPPSIAPAPISIPVASAFPAPVKTFTPDPALERDEWEEDENEEEGVAYPLENL